MEELNRWRELQQKALDETDPQRLIGIIDEMMSILLANETKVESVSAAINIPQPEATVDEGKGRRHEIS